MPSKSETSRQINREEIAALARLVCHWAGASLAEMGMALTDMAIVDRIGALELAAVGLAGGIAFDMPANLLGILTIVGVLGAEAVGAGQHERVSVILGQALRIAPGLSVLMVAFALVRAFPLAMVYAVLADMATALDRTRTVLAVSVGAVILNGPLSWFPVLAWLRIHRSRPGCSCAALHGSHGASSCGNRR